MSFPVKDHPTKGTLVIKQWLERKKYPTPEEADARCLELKGTLFEGRFAGARYWCYYVYDKAGVHYTVDESHKQKQPSRALLRNLRRSIRVD